MKKKNDIKHTAVTNLIPIMGFPNFTEWQADIKYNIVYKLQNLFTFNYHVRLAYNRSDRIVQQMDSTF